MCLSKSAFPQLPQTLVFPHLWASIPAHARTRFILLCFGCSGPGVKQPIFVLSWIDLILRLDLEWLYPLLLNKHLLIFLCGLPYAMNEIWREYNYPCLKGILWSSRPVTLKRRKVTLCLLSLILIESQTVFPFIYSRVAFWTQVIFCFS